MRKLVNGLVLILVVSSSSNALAGLVGSVSVGAALPSVELLGVESGGDAGYMLGGSIGWRFGNLIQWDWVETYYMSGEQTDVSGSYTANNFSFGTGVRIGIFGDDSRFHPYASFGIAASETSTGELFNRYNWQWGFEWNAGVGFLVNITDRFAVGGRYRYRSTSISSDNAFSTNPLDINIHTIGGEIVWGH